MASIEYLIATLMNDIEITEFGFLMYRPSYSAKFVEDVIKRRGLKGIRIFDHWEPLKSLDFLREFDFLTGLEITCRYDQDYAFLRDMPQLEELSLTGISPTMDNEIDLSSQTNVKYLALEWRKNRIKGIEACKEVIDLCLVDFACEDLRIIKGLSKVSRLRIKTGTIRNCSGIEGLSDLKEVAIGYCRRLTSIAAMTGLHELRMINIESSRKIADYELLTDLPKIDVIQLTSCGLIQRFPWKQNLPSLRELRLLVGTKIAEV